MKRTLLCLYVGLMIALCLFFSVGAFFFRPDTEAEGRELTEMPSLREEDGGVNWDYPSGLEPVFAERFALRGQLVTLNSLLRESLFATGSDRVVVGREGYLFFAETLADYTGSNPMTDEEIETVAGQIAALAEYAEARGSRFLFAAAPNKNTVYGAYMPARYLPSDDESNLDRLYAALDKRGVAYLDLRPLYGEVGLYHKRDTHWNGEGARLAYDAMLDAVGWVHDDYAGLPHRTVDDFPGDLDVLLTPSLTRTDEDIVYDLPEYRYTSNYSTAMDLVITTQSAGQGSLLLFRDSFGSALLPYFAASFAEARFERALPCRIDRLERSPADVVILEIAERNLRNLADAAERIVP